MNTPSPTRSDSSGFSPSSPISKREQSRGGSNSTSSSRHSLLSEASPILYPSSPIVQHPAELSLANDDDDMMSLRAGSELGVNIRSILEYKLEGNKWKTGFFTFDEVTLNLFRYSKDGNDALEIYEVSGINDKSNRLFKRRNRFDIFCEKPENQMKQKSRIAILSLASNTAEIKSQFIEKISNLCKPGK